MLFQTVISALFLCLFYKNNDDNNVRGRVHASAAL